MCADVRPTGRRLPARLGPPGVRLVGEQWPADEREAGRGSAAGADESSFGETALRFGHVLAKRVDVEPVDQQRIPGVAMPDAIRAKSTTQPARQH